MIPTKYELSRENNRFILRVFSPELPKGWSAIESIPIITGKSLDGLRKRGAGKAKRFGVPFIDKTKEALS